MGLRGTAGSNPAVPIRKAKHRNTTGCGAFLLLVPVESLVAVYLSRERICHAFFAPADVVFSRMRGVQPDIFVVPLVNGRRPERFEEVGRLLLAIEVLSPTTARADRVAKRTLFRDEGVAEYWIIELDSRTIERSTPADSRVAVLADRLEWLPEGAASALVIDLVEYFSQVLDG